MRPIIIIQARMGSSRLPGKVLAEIEGQPILDWVFYRCRRSVNAAGVILATTDMPADDPLESLARRRKVPVFRGSEHDVLRRYVEAAVAFRVDSVIRITADCPLIDPEIIDQAIDAYMAVSADYLYIEGYPNGLGAAEVLSVAALHRAYRATKPSDIYYREHVMTYLTSNPGEFSLCIKKAPSNLFWPELRLCVDEPLDLELVRFVCRQFAPRMDFTATEVISLLRARADMAAINASVVQKGI